MKLFLRPRAGRSGYLIFDLDGTLYHNPDYIQYQESAQIQKLAEYRNISFEQARDIAIIQKSILKKKLGRETSLAHAFRALGIPESLIVQWRKDTIVPEKWLHPDIELQKALARLASRFQLALLTNNPHSVGVASLATLGIAALFGTIVGLDDAHTSKPDPEPFQLILQKSGCHPEDCIVIGDRYDIDIAPALNEGMSGILVDGVRDIYLLPEILLP